MNIPIYQPTLDQNVRSNVLDCIDSGWISSKGKYIEEFENDFSSYLGINYSASVNNGTTALHLALCALEICEGDEVIVPTFTYIASVNAISYVGAHPVFIDSDVLSWNIDISKIEEKITKKTRAIIVVHMYGNPCNMDEILDIANKYNIYVIEDVAEAFGSKFNNIYLGGFGDVATFSFFGNKTITTGEGGMVSSNNKNIIDRVQLLKNQAVSSDKEYWHDEVGYNYRMTNIAASIGVAQLKSAQETLYRKEKINEWYYDLLKGLPINFQYTDSQSINSYWMVSILLNTNKDRDGLRHTLSKNSIETRPFFYPAHTMPMYINLSCSNEKFPVAKKLSQCGLNLPSYPDLSFESVSAISSVIRSYF